MDLGKSKEIEDSLEDARRKYHEVFLKLYDADKSNAAPKKSLFPKKKSVKPPIRASMVRRACVKLNVVSSTPMTCAKKKKFTSDHVPSMSPISNVILQKNSNNSRKERNSDSIKLDQPCSSRHDRSSCKELEKSQKQEHLNTIISKITSNKKQRQDQPQTSVANPQRKQDKFSRRYVRSLARNLFNSSVVDCEIQTGPSLTKDNTEHNSLEEEELILNNCEKGKLISKEFYDMADGDLFPGKKNDSGGPWRVSSGLQSYKNSDQDSFLALNSSADRDTSNDTFMPKGPPQKKVFINKKIGSLLKKEKNYRRKSIVSNVASNKKSPKKSKLKNQSQTNDVLDSKNKKQNITKTTTSRMVQTERQIKDRSNDHEIFNVPKQSVQEKSVYLSSNMEIICNNKHEVDCLNENIIKAKTARTVLEESCRTKYRPDRVNSENAKDIMKSINLNNAIKTVNNSKNEEADLIGKVPLAEKEICESIPINISKNNSRVRRLLSCSSKHPYSMTVEDHQINKSTKNSPVNKSQIEEIFRPLDLTLHTSEGDDHNSLRRTHSVNRNIKNSRTGVRFHSTKIGNNKNFENNPDRIEQRITSTVNTDNGVVKLKRGRPKKKSDDLKGNSNVQPGSSHKFTQNSQDLPAETVQQMSETEHQEFRRSTRKRRPAVKLTSHVVVCSSQKVFDKVRKNAPNICFVNISNDILTRKTLVCNTPKLLSPVEETESENSGGDGVQNTRAVYKKQKPTNKFGKIRKRLTVNEKQSNIARALNKTLEQPATFDTLFNIEDHRHIQTNKWCFNNPKLKNLTNMAGISIFTMDGGVSGLIKIAPKKVKPKQFVRNHDLNFAVIEGHCKVEIQNEHHILSKLALFVVRQGANYYIENISDTEDLVLHFYRIKN